MDLALGQVVYSRAGRDKGRIFVVVKLADAQHVMVSDGKLRKIEKPKKKKIKHLEITETVIGHLKDMLTNGSGISNSDIRKALAPQEVRDRYIQPDGGMV